MKIFKVIGNTLASAGEAVQDTMSLISMFVSDDGLKHTTRQSFKLVNNALDESVVISELETTWNIEEFKRKHKAKVGRPSKKDEKK